LSPRITIIECRFTYKVQDEAGGIAQALGLAENFIGSDSMMVILGDNIFQDSLEEAVKSYPNEGAQILIKQVPDPNRYGVAEIDGNEVISIEEKPHIPKSDWAVAGIYIYDSEVFDVIKTLKPSSRGELEITDVNNYYIQKGKMKSVKMQGWWTDAGTPSSLDLANKLVKENK
jgi:glucose-1-phosphate thymidylyltransferase